MLPKRLQQTDILKPLLQNADHVDSKAFEADMTMREFIAGLFSYNPSWMKALYSIRWGFVRLLGMKQAGLPPSHVMQPQDVPMQAGEMATFFRVESAEPDTHWIASAAESHLIAYLALIVEPLTEKRNRFHLVTIVHYKSWAGPVYFNVIRPFHHLVVRKMGQAAVASVPKAVLV